MLHKIVAIKNVGRFRNCTAAGDVTFRRLTFVYSENARGKTTLCSTLRSLQTNTPGLVLGRATLGSPDPPDIHLQFSNNRNVRFRRSAWDAPYPDLAVFDGAYVSENVFAGDFVDTTHRRNLYKVIIGAQGVAHATRVAELEAAIRTKNDQIREGRDALKRHFPAHMDVEAFIALAKDDAIDAKIGATELDIQAAQRTEQLQQRAGLTELVLPPLDPRLAQVLAQTFPGLAADAERRVAEHLRVHNRAAQPWITQGLDYATDSCPFCGQGLEGVTLIQAYRDYFNREYLGLRDEVQQIGRRFDEALADRTAATLEQVCTRNVAAVEFWQTYCPVAAPTLPELAQVGDILGALRRAAGALLQRKAATPLEAVPPDEAYTTALRTFDALRASVAQYNASVAAANAVIAAKKREAGAADARALQRTLETMRAQKARHMEEVVRACETDATRLQEKRALEDEKARVREQLDAHTEMVVQRYADSINRYLERINAGFRTTTPRHTYRGGPPSTSYQIVINQRAVDLGDPATPVDRPSFRNTLSAGDRSTLALAFFFAELEQDQNRAGKTVVFDDPFTSLDAFRRNQTAYQIAKCAESCAQVVVLSHDPGFLKLIWDRTQPADRKALQLTRIGEENTTIAEWDIDRAVQSPHRADIDTLQHYFSDADGDPRDVIQKIRPVLEGYCCNVRPVEFPNGDTLGVIVGKIRQAGAIHLLAPICDNLDELNLYTRRYHHGENPNARTEPVNDAELRGYVQQTLKIVGCLL